MEFHIARKVRDRYGVSELLFNYSGNVIFANIAASQELASRINGIRETEGTPGDPVHAGSLFAMGLIDELSHAMVKRFRETVDPEMLSEALRWFEAQSSNADVQRLLQSFTQQFPNVAVYCGKQTARQWLVASAEGMPNREAAFEELLLLWLSNINPAFAPFKEFFDDRDLKPKAVYKAVTTHLDHYFTTRPAFSPAIGTLLDALRAPMLASPDSLTGQLAYIRENWVEHLGDELRHILLAIDILKEEDIAIWMRFHPPSAADAARPGERRTGWGTEGFVGDEFIGFADGVRAGQASSQQPVVNEYEAFSPDQDWMPTVVLIAKSTYVWLEQLSKKYQRHIHRLDQIPDEELLLLADRGLNGLWLIGLWERSTASQTIKRLRGQADAVASAYSVADYRIAEDLGGEPAYRHLRDRCAAAGIRLASDMVPNHMGIDSTWVIEHPEWFVSRPDSPFPVYSFEGPDLSNDSRIEIKIDDHYFDQTDAAVVFRRRERRTGDTEYVFHGNDGTTFAWNDTAQLNYSKAEVREQVIQTILSVARLFPIIRFDAAMTLAKKHVQRLWFPLPGVGGAIPSRAEDSMSQAEFDALMPNEFWREVVDRVAVEVPGTLLLAEAFWLLEGYFVRTLGMHRVYNSAFMNMLRDEENAKYRSYLKKTIEFDPDILKRYVNFMSNPDERTAIDQFGSGDRYFGVCTLLATLPGLPMFGHGQVEAFTEKYGMEYKRARFEEYPNEDLVARHQREIAPLLKNRKLFAGSDDFFLYDFWTGDGTVDENVYVYSNRFGNERAIIFFNNRYGGTQGTIHTSADSMDKSSGSLRTRRLSEALHFQADDAIVIAYKDITTGLEHLRRSRDLDHHGLTLDLRAYQYVVLENWRELRSTAEQPWDTLCDALNGAGVYNLEEALSKLRVRPVHEALRQLLSAGAMQAVIDLALEKKATPAAKTAAPSTPSRKRQLTATSEIAVSRPDPRLNSFLHQAEIFLHATQLLKPRIGEQGEDDAESTLHETGRSIEAVVDLPSLQQQGRAVWPKDACLILPLRSPENVSLTIWSQVLAWSVLRALTADASEILELFDTLHLRPALAEIFSSLGIEGENAWRAAARVRVLLPLRVSSANTLASLLASDGFWKDPDIRWLVGITEFEGRTFFNKELFEELVSWLLLPELTQPDGDSLSPSVKHTDDRSVRSVEPVLAAAHEAGYDLHMLMALLASRGTVASSAPSSKKIAAKPKPATVLSSGKQPALVSSSTAASEDAAAKKPAAKKPAAKQAPAIARKPVSKSGSGKKKT